MEIEEEFVEGVSFAAYRRRSTVLRLPAKSGPAYLTRALSVDPDALDAAMERDLAIAEDPP